VGIEIPNEARDTVYLKELLTSKELREHKSKLAFPAGKDIAGRVVVADIAKMPHMLIAGTTGSGKSVFTNSILMSILYRTTPEEVRVIVIDPKVVEFQVYNKIPHLLYDVVTDPKKAAGILNWAVAEMTTRYKKFANAGARDISGYNAKVESGDYSEEEPLEKLPQILIVIDELADLMMVAAKEVEEAICRLAQLARAAGIHMVIATQRPSVDVITGLIKANIPSRVALTVASGTDSRTIIDMNGAEKLLGNGDMLFYPAGYVKPVRVQGAFVSDKEVLNTVEFIKNNSGEAEYDESIDAKLTTDQEAMTGGEDRDPIFAEAGRLCIEKQKGSTSMLQRQFKVGFNRAARVMEQLYEAGVVGQEEVNKPRKVIMSIEEFEQLLQQ
jgi:S-DNA-T family DNA segregation ATPase FtsK/SpoIIIE